jgi:hypothetical protein
LNDFLAFEQFHGPGRWGDAKLEAGLAVQADSKPGETAALLDAFDSGDDLAPGLEGIAELDGGIDEFAGGDLEDVVASVLGFDGERSRQDEQVRLLTGGESGEVFREEKFLLGGCGEWEEKGQEEAEGEAIHGEGIR